MADDAVFSTVTLETFDAHPLKLEILARPGMLKKHPVVLMLGKLGGKAPEWGVGLLREGYMFAAFTPERPPDPNPERRPVFLHFDERFAHSYARMGYETPRDAQVVFDYLDGRGDVLMDKIGWVGASSTGIPGLAVATQGPRLACVVAFVATGAYEQWLATWHTNGLWKGKTNDLWPETKALFPYDPIRHVDKMFPTAILLVSGGDDKVVDPATARSFMQAARPFYAKDPFRLRLVIYDGVGHNLPGDAVRMHVENWLHLYCHPMNPAPEPIPAEPGLAKAVENSQITGANHKDLTGAR